MEKMFSLNLRSASLRCGRLVPSTLPEDIAKEISRSGPSELGFAEKNNLPARFLHSQVVVVTVKLALP